MANLDNSGHPQVYVRDVLGAEGVGRALLSPDPILLGGNHPRQGGAFSARSPRATRMPSGATLCGFCCCDFSPFPVALGVRFMHRIVVGEALS